MGIADWTKDRVLSVIKRFDYPLRKAAILEDISRTKAEGLSCYVRGWATLRLGVRWRYVDAALEDLVNSGELVERLHDDQRFYERATVLDKLARI